MVMIWSRQPTALCMRITESAKSKPERVMQFMLSCAIPVQREVSEHRRAHGDVEPLAIQREMIRRTIKEHLDKEKRLRPLGIKVLSLFFIDAVDRYRQYDADGNPVKGDYALDI
jgi:restriction endonuclease